MIQITPHMKILVAIEPADFRRGIDGLARLCREKLAEDPFSGAIIVFCNRRRTAIKCLVYDSTGFWLMQKRLSTGRFRYWPRSESVAKKLQAHELVVLLSAGDPETTRAAAPWRLVSPSEVKKIS